MEHRTKQLLIYAGQVVAAVILFNLFRAGAAYLMHNGPITSIAYRRLLFVFNGEAYGLDLATWHDRLSAVLGFLLLVVRGYWKGAFNVKG